MNELEQRYREMLRHPEASTRAIAKEQLGALGAMRHARLDGERSAWLHVPLGELFKQAGNVLIARTNGRIVCGHEPVHSSRSGNCLVIWSQEGRWFCTSCRAGGDAIQAVRSLEGVSYPVAIARLTSRYGAPAGFGFPKRGGRHA